MSKDKIKPFTLLSGGNKEETKTCFKYCIEWEDGEKEIIEASFMDPSYDGIIIFVEEDNKEENRKIKRIINSNKIKQLILGD